jgi:N-acetylglucosaminyldiphosphoundecaprenol N-acetyl-beta-D-mannosaminyltransferase
MTNRVPVTNVWFDDVSMSRAVERIVEFAGRSDGPRYVCTGNLDHLAMLERDAEFVDVYREADLVLADGAPVLWLSRLSNRQSPLTERVAGSDLFWELARASTEHGLRLFFLGGRPGAAERAAEAVKSRHPGAAICGTYCPPHETFETTEEQSKIVDTVRAASPHVLLVAFGAPKQEKWIRRHREALGVPVSIGVGGSLEMAGGNVRRAPVWMRRTGLEWAFRFVQEPTRLFRRYFLTDIPFLARAYVRELTGVYTKSRREASADAVDSASVKRASATSAEPVVRSNSPSAHGQT